MREFIKMQLPKPNTESKLDVKMAVEMNMQYLKFSFHVPVFAPKNIFKTCTVLPVFQLLAQYWIIITPMILHLPPVWSMY